MKFNRKFKIYVNLFDKDNKRIERELREKLVLQVVKNVGLTGNKNKGDKHYPIFYNDNFYFGEPMVFQTTKEDIEKVLAAFKDMGCKFWVTHLYPLYCFQELKEQVNSEYLKHIRLVGLEMFDCVFLNDSENWATMFKDGQAIIRDWIDLNEIKRRGGVIMENIDGKQLLNQFERTIGMAELKALSRLSIERPLSDMEFNRAMELKEKF